MQAGLRAWRRDQPSNYKVTVSGISSTQSKIRDDVQAFKGQSHTYTNVPGELEGSVLVRVR